MNDIEEHLNHNYIVRVKEIRNIHGLIATFPKNILLGLEEDSFIYEVDSECVNVFSNRVKIETIPCPEYAARFLIAADISVRMYNRKINNQLIAVYSADGDLIEKGNVKIINVIMGSDNSIVCDLEAELEQSLRRYAVNGDMSTIDESVLEGFELISNRYIKGTNNE